MRHSNFKYKAWILVERSILKGRKKAIEVADGREYEIGFFFDMIFCRVT